MVSCGSGSYELGYRGMQLRERMRRGEVTAAVGLDEAVRMKRQEPWNDAGVRLSAWIEKRRAKLNDAAFERASRADADARISKPRG